MGILLYKGLSYVLIMPAERLYTAQRVFHLMSDNKDFLCKLHVLCNGKDLYRPQTNSAIFYPYCCEGCIMSVCGNGMLHKQGIKAIQAPYVLFYSCLCKRKNKIILLWDNTLSMFDD